MNDLISREAAINTIKNHYCEGCTYYDVKCKSVLSENCPIFNVISTISVVPVIDAEPVRHGKWIVVEDEYGDYARCSVCGDEFICWEGDCAITNCCPNCGAKMDLEDDE